MNNDNTELPQNEELETETPEITEETTSDETTINETTTGETVTDPTEVTGYEFVQLVPEQYDTLVGISQRTDLLTNRIEVLLILNIILVALFIFQMMRGKTS